MNPRRTIRSLLIGGLLVGFIAAFALALRTPVDTLIVKSVLDIVPRVDPTVKEWFLESALADTTIRGRLAMNLAAAGVQTTDKTGANKITIIRIQRHGLTKARIHVGCYSPPWGGIEMEYEYVFRGTWILGQRNILSQS